MERTCVICNKPIDPLCQWSACVLANKIKTAKLTLDDARNNPEYDGKYNPEWKQEIDQSTGRH